MPKYQESWFFKMQTFQESWFFKEPGFAKGRKMACYGCMFLRVRSRIVTPLHISETNTNKTANILLDFVWEVFGRLSSTFCEVLFDVFL